MENGVNQSTTDSTIVNDFYTSPDGCVWANQQEYNDYMKEMDAMIKNDGSLHNSASAELGEYYLQNTEVAYEEYRGQKPIVDGKEIHIQQLGVELGEALVSTAHKLMSCRLRGLYAYVYFNGIELNNWEAFLPEDVIEDYKAKIEKKNTGQHR